MSEEKKWEFKEPKENLHWLNFTAKKQLEVLKEIKELLGKLVALAPSKGLEGNKTDDIPF